MTATVIERATPHRPSPPTMGELRLRAQWLSSLGPAEREALSELALAEVERRFGRWLVVRAGARADASSTAAPPVDGEPGA